MHDVVDACAYLARRLGSVCISFDGDRHPTTPSASGKRSRPRQIPSVSSILFFFPLGPVKSAATISFPSLSLSLSLSLSHAPKFSGVLQTDRRRAGLSPSVVRNPRFKLREGREMGAEGGERGDFRETTIHSHPIKGQKSNKALEVEVERNGRTAFSKLDVTNESRTAPDRPSI